MESDAPQEKRQAAAAKVDASTEMPDFGATSSTVDVGTEMTPRPAPTPQRPAKPSKPSFSTEVCPRSRWPRLSPEDCPLLGGILDYLAAGRVDLAMQCIFSVGDEQTLRSVLQRLDSGEVWLQLPSPEAKHLVKLLVALICRDPYSPAAKEACPWLETFLRSPYQALLPSEEPTISNAGVMPVSCQICRALCLAFPRWVACWAQWRHEFIFTSFSRRRPQVISFISFISFVEGPLRHMVESTKCLWIGTGGGREDLRFLTEGGFDGAYTYFAAEGFTPGSNTKSWQDVSERLRKIGKIFVPSVGPGYDDTRIRPWNKHNIRLRKDGASYDRMWSAAVKSRPHAISVTSYNEWGEGTQIEPAVKHRSARGEYYPSYIPQESTYYLEITRYWSKTFKDDQCSDDVAKSEL
eukprot:s911_g10.t1